MSFQLRHELPREQGSVEEPDFARWRDADDATAATFHRIPGGFLVRFIDRADFVISLADKVVTCLPTPDISERAACDLYLNQVVPMLRGYEGDLIIHASAVAIGGRAAAFVARSGRGKSTLAAAFARAGMPFLSDDGVSLTPGEGGYLADPNRPSFRLWMDSEAEVVLGQAAPAEQDGEKSLVDAGETLPFQSEPLPLGALYFLGPGDSAQPVISPMPRRQALAELLNHSFFLDADDRERMKRHFEALTRLAETVPSFALDYPRRYDRLPSVVRAVSSHLSN